MISTIRILDIKNVCTLLISTIRFLDINNVCNTGVDCVNLSMVGVEESYLWDTVCKVVNNKSSVFLSFFVSMADRVMDVAQQAIAAVRDARRSLDDADDFVSGVTQTFYQRQRASTSRRRRGRRNGMPQQLWRSITMLV